ncbi:toxin-antitoxin system HicB family antitoxin [Malikia sp.]|uniref:toxin-antitoxin system HicB family antitoxin n=1 Tax=Malikia sp. TaxID=2070706 RepID=UPI00260B04E7|nr:toxin-antitoxin system HicB family antitoxin [Malikia sp.]MDD2729622.1 toxin-antitoxin system HicB family antitoxin [Malikia sp.]
MRRSGPRSSSCGGSRRRAGKLVCGKLILRVPPELHRATLIAAEFAGTSLNQWAAKVLGEAARGVQA